MQTVYQNTKEKAKEIGWNLVPEHCFGNKDLPFVVHAPKLGTFFYVDYGSAYVIDASVTRP